MSIATYNINRPRGVFSGFNGFVKGLDTVVWVFAAESASGGAVESLKKYEHDQTRNQQVYSTNLETTVSNDVDLGINEAAIIFDELVGVTGVSVLVVVTIWGAAIAE